MQPTDQQESDLLAVLRRSRESAAQRPKRRRVPEPESNLAAELAGGIVKMIYVGLVGYGLLMLLKMLLRAI